MSPNAETSLTTRFVIAACVPVDQWHASGTLDEANTLLATNPEIGTADIYTASILGDDATVRALLAENLSAATAKGGPHNWAPLTYLCFSRYLRLDSDRSPGFVSAATSLLDAGGDPNGGWFEPAHQPSPTWESVLYGAAGVARNPGVTRLLMERGANPNDDEVPYHAPETYDNTCLEILVNSGKLNADSLNMILLRKTDWHDEKAIRWLLERGVDPNRRSHWGHTAIHGAVRSDNALAIVEQLIDHGADAKFVVDGKSAVALAARRGRRDLLEFFEKRGIIVELSPLERLIAACARDNETEIATILNGDPALASELRTGGGALLSAFATNANALGATRLLALGVPVDELFVEGSGYHGEAARSTALHAAAWHGRHEVVRLLVEHGANVNARDGRGRTPLMLAVSAAVDSYWTYRKGPESVAALLAAGAAPDGIHFPTGYDEMDVLLRPHVSET
ncbi:MAG: ankyrin repeat domain-containing protein [Gemmatimonadaceae bacterium]